MALDISRRTDNPSRHYSRVIHQQARVHVDADHNEQQAIELRRLHTTARDVIGDTGCPTEGGGFAIAVAQGGGDFTIAPGRIYVDGILAELTPTVVEAQLTAANQVTVPQMRVDDLAWTNGQTVELFPDTANATQLGVGNVDTTNRILTLSGNVPNANPGDTVQLRRVATYTAQPDYVAPPAGNLQPGRYRVYLDVWEQELSWVQDPAIREIALGGPDTAGRARVRAQVRLDRFGDPGSGTCPDAFGDGWKPAAPSGRLRARINPEDSSSNPCLLPPTSGYQGLENQLYRVQVHGGGNAGDKGCGFKWQRDDASIVTAVEEVESDTATVFDVGRDDVLCFDEQHLAEPSDDRSDLSGQPWPLQKVLKATRAARTIQLDAPLPAIDPLLHAKLQRWDAQGAIVAPAGDDWVDLEFGLQVQFSAGSYSSGDFWLIPARTALGEQAGTIDWPVDDSGAWLAQPPQGVVHHYAPLGLIDYQGGAFSNALDCRPMFPPLTAISMGSCTLTAVPGPGWESVFDSISDGQDAHICFRVGDYPISTPKLVQNKGNLVLDGAGPGTRILGGGDAEACLVFDGCAGVEVRDLHAETTVVGASSKTPTEHLNGTLNFVDCPDVQIESVSVSCGGATYRGASCITVASRSATADAYRSLRVRGCDLAPGHQQVGLLVVNQDRAVVEDCVVRGGTGLPRTFDFLKDVQFRSALQRAMVNDVQVAAPGTKPAGGDVVTTPISKGGPSLVMRTDPALQGAWSKVFDRFRPSLFSGVTQTTAAKQQTVMKKTTTARGAKTRAATARADKKAEIQAAPVTQQVSLPAKTLTDVRRNLMRFTTRLLPDPAELVKQPGFHDWVGGVLQEVPVSASQGIVVGGQAPTTVRILNNTVSGVMMGIHVAVSQHRPQGGAREQTGPVLISGNIIDVQLTVDAWRGRHAIFVGNCASLVVEANHATLTRASGATMACDAIRIWGVLGRMVVVRHNHVDGFSVGVTLQPVPKPATANPLWLVADNLLAATTGLNTGPGVITTPNNVT